MTDSRLSTSRLEALAEATSDSRATFVRAETLTYLASPDRRIISENLEVLLNGTGISRRLGMVAVEVLAPSLLNPTGYAGWGIKL